jgi:hypothetical protein
VLVEKSRLPSRNEFCARNVIGYFREPELNNQLTILKNISIILIFICCSCKTQTNLDSTFNFFFRKSRTNFQDNENRDKWIELKNDTVIYTRYYKGSPCDIPIPENMKGKIINDTLYFDNGNFPNPDCDSRIGSAAIIVDFVINKKKYPNYKKLYWKQISKTD